MHLCVQSGSDHVLQGMRRGYRVADFKNIVDVFRKEIPELTLWTDIIVGFPGESQEDFLETLALIKEVKFDFVNVSGYAVRKGTFAAKMKQIASEVKKERSVALSKAMIAASLARNQTWIGWKGTVLVDEYKKEKKNFIGRTATYKPVVLREHSLTLGSAVEVEIVDATATHLVGEIIK